jgi:signal transduction histidine kinase
MRIRTKLVLYFLLVTVMFVIEDYVSQVSINNIVQARETTVLETLREHNKLDEIKISYISAKSDLREFMLSEPPNVTEYRLQLDRVNKGILDLLEIEKQSFEQLEGEAGEEEISERIYESWQEIQTTYPRIIESGNENTSSENMTLLLAEARRMEGPFESLINQRIEEENEELEQRIRLTQDYSASAINLLFLVTGIAIALSLGVGIFISRSIVNPIRKIMHAAREISHGNLTTKVTVPSRDEIGELAKRFDDMRESIRLTNENLNTLVKSRTKELESANEELKQKDRIKDEFISIASHELKTPVHPILELAEAAKEGLIGHEEAWELVFKHAMRLQRLTNDILDVSRIETGQLTYRFEKVPINQIIRNVVRQILVNINKDLQIQLNLVKEIEIDGDKDRLVQVFVNILENAKKFTKRGKIKVESRVFAETNMIEIRVSDTGTGISSDILPEIFDKFVTRGEPGGTGLGLFISKAIVNAHGGKISAQNNEEGGATIIIILPITKRGEPSVTKP